MKFNIEHFLSLEGYEQSRLDRRKNNKEGKSTNEFFTPYSIVKRMCDKVSEEDWADPDKAFLEPCFGNGQFVVYIIWNRIQHGVHWWWALRNLYGVELMQDNVEETKQRVIKLLDALEVDYDEDLAMDVMDYNLVCSDFFDWDFDAWCKKGETPRTCTTKIIGDEEYKEFR